MVGFGGSLKAPLNGALHRLEMCLDGVAIGESQLLPYSGRGGVGGMKAPLNGRIASAITVHGGSHSSVARLIGRACVWYGSNPSDRPPCGPVAMRGAGVPKA